jgi:hypothetical protein
MSCDMSESYMFWMNLLPPFSGYPKNVSNTFLDNSSRNLLGALKMEVAVSSKTNFCQTAWCHISEYTLICIQSSTNIMFLDIIHSLVFI